MTKEVSAELPPGLSRLLDGHDLEGKEGETFLLLSVGADGWPYVAMLSVGEVLAVSARELRFALWPKSTTTQNLRRNPAATLMLVHEQTAYDIQLEVTPVLEGGVLPASQVRFAARVRRVLTDTVGYAELLSGIRFRLTLRDQVLPQWRLTVQALRG